jgi:hypothetical protein
VIVQDPGKWAVLGRRSTENPPVGRGADLNAGFTVEDLGGEGEAGLGRRATQKKTQLSALVLGTAAGLREDGDAIPEH